MEEEQVKRETTLRTDLLIPASIIVAGALVALGIYFSGGTGGTTQQPAPTGRPPAKTVEIDKNDLLAGGMTLGNPEAPLVIAEFADFQCPFAEDLPMKLPQRLSKNM